jgi:molybdate/tungstate transport system permease protein
LTWARAVSEFGAVLFIAYTPYTVPTLMLYRFNGWGLSHARPMAILFLLICLWVFVILRLVKRNPFRRVVEV